MKKCACVCVLALGSASPWNPRLNPQYVIVITAIIWPATQSKNVRVKCGKKEIKNGGLTPCDVILCLFAGIIVMSSLPCLSHPWFEKLTSQPFVFWGDGFLDSSVPFTSHVTSPVSLYPEHTHHMTRHPCNNTSKFQRVLPIYIYFSKDILLAYRPYLVAHRCWKRRAASLMTRVSYGSLLHSGQRFRPENLSKACRHARWKTWEQDSKTWKEQ